MWPDWWLYIPGWTREARFPVLFHKLLPHRYMLHRQAGDGFILDWCPVWKAFVISSFAVAPQIQTGARSRATLAGIFSGGSDQFVSFWMVSLHLISIRILPISLPQKLSVPKRPDSCMFYIQWQLSNRSVFAERLFSNRKHVSRHQWCAEHTQR